MLCRFAIDFTPLQSLKRALSESARPAFRSTLRLALGQNMPIFMSNTLIYSDLSFFDPVDNFLPWTILCSF